MRRERSDGLRVYSNRQMRVTLVVGEGTGELCVCRSATWGVHPGMRPSGGGDGVCSGCMRVQVTGSPECVSRRAR